MPASTSFALFIGEDATLDAIIYQADQVTRQNITGWSITFAFHASGGGPDLVTKTVGDGITLTSPSLGELSIVVESEDTEDLDAANYQFRVERTGSGVEAELIDGIVTLKSK